MRHWVESWTRKRSLLVVVLLVVAIAGGFAWRQHSIVGEHLDRFEECRDLTAFLRLAPTRTRPWGITDSGWAKLEARYVDKATRLVAERFTALEARYRDPGFGVDPEVRVAILAMLAASREGDRTRMRTVVRDKTDATVRAQLGARGVELDHDATTMLSVYVIPVYNRLLPTILDIRNPFETTPEAELELEIGYAMVPGLGRYVASGEPRTEFEAIGFAWQIRVRAGERELDAFTLSTSPDELLELLQFQKFGSDPRPLTGKRTYFEMARTAARALGLAVAKRYKMEPAEDAIKPVDWRQRMKECTDSLGG